jgi:predicted hotdog family 3-hydroxylacyl-ACP dehydratase
MEIFNHSPELLSLLPHRSSMLLIHELICVNAQSSSARVFIGQHSAFFEKNLGVPAWIGVEYMGQTAALIAGYQLRQGLTQAHRGFLLGARHFVAHCHYFAEGATLVVACQEKAVVGDTLATFDCTIHDDGSGQLLAESTLSVFRKPLLVEDLSEKGKK